MLKKFKKNGKRNKIIIISSVIGILLIIGTMVLFKAYAFYEEKKSFNVLKGKIPDFGYDIKMLSVVVDGEKKTNIPERGLYKTQIDCTNSTIGRWDYNAWNLILENVSEQAKCNITFTTNGITEAEQNALIEEGKAKRRNTYRGKDITEYYNDGSLYTMINSGKFDDIYVGDYIKTTFNGNEYIWLIADIDNYLNSGDAPLTKHHATIIPAMPIMNISMNDNATTAGGYANSKMVTEVLPSLVAKDGIINAAFGSHILEYRNLITRTVDPDGINSTGSFSLGASQMWIFHTRKLDLMGEINVFGSSIFGSSGFDIGIDNRQYALFRLKPEFINSYRDTTFYYWLKDVIDTKGFGVVSEYGFSECTWYDATTEFGVRPRFLIN